MPFVKTHQPCNDCGSSDGLAVNDDGWSHCFVCDGRAAPQSDDLPHTNMEVRVDAKQLSVTHEDYVTFIECDISDDTSKSYKCAKE